MHYIKSILLIFFLALFLAACSSDSSTEPTDDSTNDNTTTNASGQPMPTLGEGQSPDGLMAAIQYAYDTGVPGVPPIELSMGYAQFGTMVSAGTVIVNDNQLSETNSSGKFFYMKPGVGSYESLANVSFNGSTHSWSVSGNGDIPALNGEIQSVRSFNLTAPANNATVSKSQNLEVAWSGANTSDGKMMILLIDVATSNVITSEQDLPNNGSYTIEASNLSSASGQALLQIVKYNYEAITAGGKNFYMITEVVRTATLTVQ